MLSPFLVVQSRNKTTSEWLYVVAGLVAAYVFIAHGLSAIFQTSQYLSITEYVGFSDALGNIFMKVVGSVDILVGLFLFFRPSKPLLIWGSIWVLVPLYLQYVVDGEFEIVAKAMFWIAVVTMFLTARRNKNRVK